MKYRKGIDLLEGAAPVGDAVDLVWLNLEKLGDQYTLHAKCASCGRVRWFNRQYLEARFGLHAYVNSLSPRLKCTACGNSVANGLGLGE